MFSTCDPETVRIIAGIVVIGILGICCIAALVISAWIFTKD